MGRVLSERVMGDLGEVFDRLKSSLYPKRRVTTGLPTIHPSAHDCLARPPSKTSQEPDVITRVIQSSDHEASVVLIFTSSPQ
jgi:hypothetical protein